MELALMPHHEFLIGELVSTAGGRLRCFGHLRLTPALIKMGAELGGSLTFSPLTRPGGPFS